MAIEIENARIILWLTEAVSNASALAKQPDTRSNDFCPLTVYFRFECGLMGCVVYCIYKRLQLSSSIV